MTATEVLGRAWYEELLGRLEQAEVPDARNTLRFLWKALAGTPPFGEDRPVTPADRDRLDAAVTRLCEGEPLAYVIGRTPFRHLDLVVDSRVLIPRPETEGLVQLILDRHRGGEDVLEIGVGSGCISLALATEGSFHSVIGVEISNDALAVADENRRSCAVTHVQFRHGNGDAALYKGETFDIIVSNPPYLTTSEYQSLDPAVRHHEPEVALASGEDGMDCVRMVCEIASRRLRPGGWVAMEVDARRAGAAEKAAREHGFATVTVTPDVFDRPRYLVASP